MSKMRFVMQIRNILNAVRVMILLVERLGRGGCDEILACSACELVHDNSAYYATDDADDGGDRNRCSRLCEGNAADEDDCLDTCW